MVTCVSLYTTLNPHSQATMSLATLSPAMKHIRKYLIHAKQVEKVDMKMAYSCTYSTAAWLIKVCPRSSTSSVYRMLASCPFHVAGRMRAAQEGQKVPNRAKEDTAYLVQVRSTTLSVGRPF